MLHHLRLNPSKILCSILSLGFDGPGKMFQKRRVSSPAPVTTVLPSGFIAR